MKIEQYISSTIKSNLAENVTIVAICGAADLGKSFLSRQLVSMLTQQNFNTSHLTLDSYLINRFKRKQKGISGYEIESYFLEKAKNDIIKIKNGQSVEYKPYDHKTGVSSNAISERIDSKTEILIFDGLHSMDSSFMNNIDISIFIYTDDSKLKKIRKTADLSKRGYTIEYSNMISEREFNKYKNNVEPYKQNANIVLFLKSKWHYEIKETDYNN